MTSQGRKIHGEAEEARELKQNFLDSLNLIDKAIIAYQKEKDLRGVSEALQSRSSTFEHLWQKTKDETFLILAEYSALAGLKIAEALNNPVALVMPFRGLGKIYETTEEYNKAAKYFTKAVKTFIENPPPENNRPAVVADMKAHQFACEYLSGNKQAYPKLLKAIKDLEKSNEIKYNKDVWLSGAHMRAAKCLKKDNPQKAKEHFLKAKQIIDANSELKLRKKQLEELGEKIEVNGSVAE